MHTLLLYALNFYVEIVERVKNKRLELNMSYQDLSDKTLWILVSAEAIIALSTVPTVPA